jgi:hypothetical protein
VDWFPLFGKEEHIGDKLTLEFHGHIGFETSSLEGLCK